MQQTQHRKRLSVVPWLLLFAWVAIIWGHSLMPGSDSSAESLRFVNLAQKAVYVIYQQHFSLVDRLAAEHPYFLRSLTDPNVMHFYVRKAAHFTEYFILGLLTLNAARKTFRGPFVGTLVTCLFWAGVPSVDEYIQLHVPDRAGQLTDVLIDMCGFGTALVLGLAVWAVFAAVAGVFGALFGGGRAEVEDDYA